LNCSDDFGPFYGKAWINCSHQGPLPRVAAEAAEEAIRWKQAPYELTSARFSEAPARLRSALAKLLGTANFFNFVPWAESIEYLLEKGIDNIARDDDALVARLVDGLEARGYQVLSPKTHPERSTLVLASHPDRTRNEAIHRTLRENDIEIAFRRGNLRFSPHLYNTAEDIDRALDALPR